MKIKNLLLGSAAVMVAVMVAASGARAADAIIRLESQILKVGDFLGFRQKQKTR